MPVPKWLATVQDGKLIVDRRDDFRRYIGGLKGKTLEVTVRERGTQRSNQQSRWEWGVAIKLLAEHCGYDRHEQKALHYDLVKLCFGTHVNPTTGFEIPNVVNSSQLSTKEFGVFMEWIVKWAAEFHGVIIPLPDDVDLDNLEDYNE